MTLEQILERYPCDRADLQRVRLTLTALRQNILDESSQGPGEYVQNSEVSDPTAKKALRLAEKSAEYEHREKILAYRCGMIENALTVLTATEAEIIYRFYFRRQPYPAIDLEMGVPERTCRKRLKSAKEKMRPLLAELLK